MRIKFQIIIIAVSIAMLIFSISFVLNSKPQYIEVSSMPEEGIVLFQKDDCLACVEQKYEVNKYIKKMNGTIYTIKYNDDNKNLFEKYDIQNVPSFVLIKDGAITKIDKFMSYQEMEEAFSDYNSDNN